MEPQQPEFWVIDSIAEKPAVRLAPDAHLYLPVCHKLHIADQCYAIVPGKVTHAGFRIVLEVGCFPVQLGAFGGDKVNIRKSHVFCLIQQAGSGIAIFMRSLIRTCRRISR